jgi:hypothetical protein
MAPFGYALFVVMIFAAVVGLCFLHRSLDKNRITEYVCERGGRIVSITWAPFGKGWFGEKNDRIYEVVYYDAEGNQHWATCKTGVFSGVYWTEDRTSHGRESWFAQLPIQNVAGDPPIRHLPAEEGRTDGEFHPVLSLTPEKSADAQAIDAEIAALQERIAGLEVQKQELQKRSEGGSS